MLRFTLRQNPSTVIVLSLLLAGAFGVPGLVSAADRISLQQTTDMTSGTHVVVPIEASSEIGVVSASFGLTYSPKLLTPIGVYTTPLTQGFELSFDIDTPGDLTVDIRGTNPIFEPGAIVWVLLENHGAVGDGSELTLHDALLNDTDFVELEHGWLEVMDAPRTLSLPADLTGAPGEVIVAPLSIDDATGIRAMRVTVQFDDQVLDPVDVRTTPISSALSDLANLDDVGQVTVVLWATGGEVMAGSGEILLFDFEVVGQSGDDTPLFLVEGSLNEGSIESLLQDGYFVVQTVCELDWNCDGVVDFSDAYTGDSTYADGGFYEDNFLYRQYNNHPTYGPLAEGGWFHKRYCGQPGNLDWDGNGVIEFLDFYAGTPSPANQDSFYTQYYVYTRYPQYYDLYYPDSNCD